MKLVNGRGILVFISVFISNYLVSVFGSKMSLFILSFRGINLYLEKIRFRVFENKVFIYLELHNFYRMR
jgi:hypothetical protein